MADYQLTQTGAEVQAILDAVDDIQTDVGTLQTDVGELQSALDGKVNTTDIATTSDLGLVKPDGSTITIEADGTIHSVGGRVLLWTNPSTSTPFPAQNVLSASQISAYTSFEIEVRNYIAGNIYNICKITKDSPRQVWVFDTSTMGANSGVPAITNRQVTIDSNGLSFATGYSKATTNSGSAGATDTVCIPCRIWGIVDFDRG